MYLRGTVTLDLSCIVGCLMEEHFGLGWGWLGYLRILFVNFPVRDIFDLLSYMNGILKMQRVV